MISDITFQICLSILCAAATILLVLMLFYAVCAVCKAIEEKLYPHDRLPRW